MNTDSESKPHENQFSDKEIVTVNISWDKAADLYSTLLKFTKSQPCYLAQEVMQLHILQSIFLQKLKQCSTEADVRQILQKACKSLIDLHSQRNSSDEAEWSISMWQK